MIKAARKTEKVENIFLLMCVIIVRNKKVQNGQVRKTLKSGKINVFCNTIITQNLEKKDIGKKRRKFDIFPIKILLLHFKIFSNQTSII